VRKISLRLNSFNGTTPSSLSKCMLLRSMFLQDNLFFGNLPPEIANLTSLQILNVIQNHISSSIPGELPISLETLDLSLNAFSERILTSIVNLSQVQLINLSYNRFSGEIPVSVGELQQLQYLLSDHNLLGGTLPSTLANCFALLHLSMEGNALIGVIPSAILARLQ